MRSRRQALSGGADTGVTTSAVDVRPALEQELAVVDPRLK